MDPRTVEHAKILVEYSCKVGRGEAVLVMANAEAIPLAREIAREVGRVGGDFYCMLQDDSIERAYLLAADDETIQREPEPMRRLIEACDAFIQIRSDSNTKEMGDVPPKKMKLFSRAVGTLTPLVGKKRWNVTLHPTASLAQEAGRSLEAYTDFVYGATLVDWPEMARRMQTLADRMGATRSVRITGKETDIVLSIEGRRPIVDSGEHNLPGGEVFTSPLEDSANGTVYFDKPIIHLGNVVSGVRLTYENGLIVDHRAEEGGDYLDSLLETDAGSKRMGELGIGMNRGIRDFSRNILFDEKMGDTIHMAVGLGFPEAGGTNVSGIHIDMIKGMKAEGAILFDDEPVYSNGRFVWE
ncbi:MAG: aminopeptidase [Nitrososphaerales archaeon]